ncbi:MFS transporter [Rhodococcus opacus]|uniref:MFS transporter n=1 Tax=Rhodococcus opacus TaxID=37919 RepID=UPI002473BAA0|nr:MFS transporter [Rhodococcus opacus]
MSRGDEFRRGWPTLSAAAVGVGTGVSGLAIYSAGLFTSDLGREIGLSAAMYGLSITLLTFGMALAAPVVGYAVDKFGVKAPTIAGALCLATGFAALGTVVHSVPAYMTAMALIGFFGASSGPIAFTRAVSSWFDRARGLALGITMMGMGLSGAIIPVAIGRVIELEGWRLGYLTLACIALAGTLPTLFLLKVAPRSVSTLGTPGLAADDGDDFAAIRRNPLYWRLVLTFGLMSVAFTGLIPYLVPMLRQYGMSVGGAASIASIMGLAVILSRLVIGLLIDVLRPTAVAASLCVLCATGVVLFAVGGVGFAPVLAFTLGCMLGAELDMVGYFTSRYFGLAAFGKAYAGPYMAFVLGGGIAPLWVGAVVDRTGSYTAVLYLVGALTVLCAVAFVALPSPRGPRQVTPGPSDTRPTPATVNADL